MGDQPINRTHPMRLNLDSPSADNLVLPLTLTHQSLIGILPLTKFLVRFL
jgi:hypothetical protein